MRFCLMNLNLNQFSLIRSLERDIKDARDYARRRLDSRQVTLRSEAFLKMYIQNAEKCLEDPSKENKIRLSTYTDILHSKAFLTQKPSPEQLKEQQAIKKLAKMKYLAKYRDYLTKNCRDFRQAATQSINPEINRFCDHQTWRGIQDGLDREERDLALWEKGGEIGKPSGQSLTWKIGRACQELDLDKKNILVCISWYSKRNSTMHSNLGQYIKECDWHALGRKLYHNQSVLPKIFGLEQYEQMKSALRTIQERYFVKLSSATSVPSRFALERSLA